MLPPSTDSKSVSSVQFSENFTPTQQAHFLKFVDIILRGKGGFARSVGSRLETKEVSVYERPEDRKTHATVVFEINMREDMLNPAGNMHGGCVMFLIDVCSALALGALSMAVGKKPNLVSQAINTIFHAPAQLGATLRIVNKTTSFGGRTVSARTEIWDVTNRRLVATGIHNQMQPSPPKL